jgi:hypothetical protein
MGAAESVALDRDVAPGETYDVSVTFAAPVQRGKHRSQWRLRAPDGTTFGTRPYVQVRVVGTVRATQTATGAATRAAPAEATQGATAEATQAATAEATRAATPGATPPPPTPEVVTGLDEELYFTLAGGGATDFGHLCLQPPPGVAVPAIAGHGRLASDPPGDPIHTEDDGVVCLYGIPSDGEMAVDLFTPGGELAGSAVFRVAEDGLGGRSMYQIYPELTGPPFTVDPALAGEPIVGSAQVVDGLEVISISIWLPAGLPSGQWRMAARWKGGRIEAPFAVEGPDRAIVNPMPTAAIDPFRGYRAANHAYVPGEEVRFQGAGFEANSRFPLGLYFLTGERSGIERRGVLVHGQMVSTDAAGSFSAVVQTGGFQPGTYMIVSNPDGVDYREGLSFFTVAE